MLSMPSIFESWVIEKESAELPFRFNIVSCNLRAFAVAQHNACRNRSSVMALVQSWGRLMLPCPATARRTRKVGPTLPSASLIFDEECVGCVNHRISPVITRSSTTHIAPFVHSRVSSANRHDMPACILSYTFEWPAPYRHTSAVTL